jgi:hypothetical protein
VAGLATQLEGGDLQQGEGADREDHGSDDIHGRDPRRSITDA